MAAVGSGTKDARIDLRVSQTQKAVLEQAAELLGKKLSDFVISVSTEAAQLALADQSRLALSDSNMELFLAQLEKEPQVVPGLQGLLARKSVFEK